MDRENERRNDNTTTRNEPSETKRHGVPGTQSAASQLPVQRQADLGPRPAGNVTTPRSDAPDSVARAKMFALFGSVQRASTAPDDDAAQVHAAAARGTATASTELPHLEQIQRSFGRHDVSGVKAHVGGDAAESARAMGAQAYAAGDHVVLGGGADLHTVAHEAAHVVQQRGGVQLKGGVGEEGDAYERHADEVADQVVAGRSAEHLLDRMASGGRAEAPSVQRVVENATYSAAYPSTSPDGQRARVFFDHYDAAVQQAYQFAVSVPSLGALAALNGHTQRWVEKWEEHLRGGAPKMMAATFGYVIESLVSDSFSPLRPTPPDGCSVLPQLTCGGTRPDLVLVHGSTQVAWLDLTASGSVDHIKDKDNWAEKIGIFAEVTYPSLDLGTLALMKQNKENTGPLSPADFEKRKAAAQEEHRRLKTHWTKLGEGLAISNANVKAELKAARLTRELIDLDKPKGQAFIRTRLEKLTNVTGLDNKLVPSILTAMGVSAAPWGYQTGFSQSEKAGEAWLIDNCPLRTASTSSTSSGSGVQIAASSTSATSSTSSGSSMQIDTSSTSATSSTSSGSSMQIDTSSTSSGSNMQTV